jgi:hypothetical protein
MKRYEYGELYWYYGKQISRKEFAPSHASIVHFDGRASDDLDLSSDDDPEGKHTGFEMALDRVSRLGWRIIDIRRDTKLADNCPDIIVVMQREIDEAGL